jgi:para-aminobenzoate synthetase component 1
VRGIVPVPGETYPGRPVWGIPQAAVGAGTVASVRHRALPRLDRLRAGEPAAVLRSPEGWVVAWEPLDVVCARGSTAFDALDGLEPGWWAGFCSFELGHAVERVTPRPGIASPQVPDLGLVRFARRAVVSDLRQLGATHGRARVGPPQPGTSIALGQPGSSLDGPAYRRAVSTILDLIADGACYQVNLTRQLSWADAPRAWDLFTAVVSASPAPHAGLLQIPTDRGDIAIVSGSPERFLAWRGSAVETRPIKGTATHARALSTSAKDRAENVMIVDLARNDLGRVCLPGSIRVPALCAIEEHPGLVHLVSTVRGALRPGVSLGELLHATFPPASVTGAPKPRVLQIIEDLEPCARGVYCGAMGWIDTERAAGTGSGIVADSDPSREWAETELKAARFLWAAGALPAPPRRESVPA